MADYLWDQYEVVGLVNALYNYHDIRSASRDLSDALTSTARATYKQFCERHGLVTGLTERKRTMTLTFYQWMCERGVKSNNKDVAKLALVIQIDEEFPDIRSSEEGISYVREFLTVEDIRAPIEDAIRKAWDEYVADNHETR